MFQTACVMKETGSLNFINHDKNHRLLPWKDVPVMMNRHNPFKQLPADASAAVEVKLHGDDALLTQGRIRSMLTGPPEDFRARIGLYDEGSVTVALWLEFKRGVTKRFEFMLGGKPLEISFSLSQLGGHDGIPGNFSEMMVLCKQTTSSIQFRPGSQVTEWAKLEDHFQDSLETPGVEVPWKDGNHIYIRFSLKAQSASNGPAKATLELEAIVLKDAIDTLPAETRAVLQGGASRTFLLWSCDVAWNAPVSRALLCTSPGLYRKSPANDPYPTDAVIRCHMYNALDLSRRGSHTDGRDWDEYLAKPYKVPMINNVPYDFPIDTKISMPVGEKEKPKGD